MDLSNIKFDNSGTGSRYSAGRLNVPGIDAGLC